MGKGFFFFFVYFLYTLGCFLEVPLFINIFLFIHQKEKEQPNFQEGNMVMVYLHKEIFLVGSYSYSKLSKGKIGPYRIISEIAEKIKILRRQ